MFRGLLLLLPAAAAFAADDPWAKVKELKSGTEIRIYKRGASSPLVGKIDEARDHSLTVVLKNEQVTVEKDQIDRLDYRPLKPGGRLVTESNEDREPGPEAPHGHEPRSHGSRHLVVYKSEHRVEARLRNHLPPSAAEEINEGR